jgi:hypothetical protein
VTVEGPARAEIEATAEGETRSFRVSVVPEGGAATPSA